MGDKDCTGKIAFVTGAGAGIGHAIALEWARRGGTTIVTDLDVDSARAVAGEITAAGDRAFAYELDVRNVDAIRSTIGSAAQAAGGLDVLFNVAGINKMHTVEDLDDEEWYSIIDTNLTSVYRCSKYAVPEIRKRGGGAIVHIASLAGVWGESRAAAYTASKGGVVMLTRNMAMDFADANIRVNAICPGATRSPRNERNRAAKGINTSEFTACPMKRRAEPEEIARPAVFLASADASYITGHALVVDGGWAAGFRTTTFG